MARLLLAEDDAAIAALIRATLSNAKPALNCHHVANLAALNQALTANIVHYEVLILDWMLPDGAGVHWLQNWRRQSHPLRLIPVLMLTARASEDDKVVGLNSGADDYLTKPFAPRELLARISALRRRASDRIDFSSQLQYGDLCLDLTAMRVSCNNNELTLLPLEIRLLQTFLTAPQRLWTREELLTRVWTGSTDLETRTVDVTVSRLRKAIASSTVTIQTVRGSGYRLHTDHE